MKAHTFLIQKYNICNLNIVLFLAHFILLLEWAEHAGFFSRKIEDSVFLILVSIFIILTFLFENHYFLCQKDHDLQNINGTSQNE